MLNLLLLRLSDLSGFSSDKVPILLPADLSVLLLQAISIVAVSRQKKNTILLLAGIKQVFG